MIAHFIDEGVLSVLQEICEYTNIAMKKVFWLIYNLFLNCFKN